MGSQDGVADDGIAAFDVFYGEIIRKMPRTYNFNPIFENKNPDRGGHKIVAMDQCIGNNLFQRNSGDFGFARGVYAFIFLYMFDIAQYETETCMKNIRQFP